MALVDLIIATSATTLAVFALFFAIFQSLAAYAQLLSAANRCGRPITEVFDLQDGFYMSFRSLTPSVRYRMPVITMPGLRKEVPVMGQAAIPQVFTSGDNYWGNINGYVDERRTRVASNGGHPAAKIDKGKTFISVMLAILWTPFGAIASVVLYACFSPCATCCAIELICCCQKITEQHGIPDCGCGGGKTSGECLVLCLAPVMIAWNDVVKYEDSGVDTEAQVLGTRTPALEPAAWAQFLASHQLAWWGHASIRWEWRLATSIPSDVWGATVETTIADLQLIAVMSGMMCINTKDTLAQSLCGEVIDLSQHPVLGQLAWYRSNRENTHESQHIAAKVPIAAPVWLYHCVQACRKVTIVHETLNVNRNPDVLHPETQERINPSLIRSILRQFSRMRTAYDAQLPFSCGDAMWIFDTSMFKQSLNNYVELSASAPAKWTPKNVVVLRGPLGSGLKNCSCNRCCQEWHNELEKLDELKYFRELEHEYVWPALMLHTHVDHGIFQIGGSESCREIDKIQTSTSTQVRTVASALKVEIHLLCHKSCTGGCSCGHIARSTSNLNPLALEEGIAIASINTKWLSRVDPKLIESAAETLIFNCFRPMSPTLIDVMAVMVYTETLLLRIRQDIGSQNIWNSPNLNLLSEFRPISLG